MTVYFEKAEKFSRGHDLLAPVKRRVYGPERFAVTGQLFVPLGVPTIGERRMGGQGFRFPIGTESARSMLRWNFMPRIGIRVQTPREESDDAEPEIKNGPPSRQQFMDVYFCNELHRRASGRAPRRASDCSRIRFKPGHGTDSAL